MEAPPAPAYDGIAPTEAETAIWDWGNLLDFSFANDDPLILPWGTPEEAGTPPQVESPPFPLSSPHSAALPSPGADSVGRVRKRDPRLVCPNYLAGVVPCSCPEVDEKVMEAEKVAVGARKRARSGGASTSVVRCQVPGCEADISELKGYHKRHRVCLECANASSVELNGEQKRYCQQCGKFHVLANFDEGKRSCRRKLERHNKRRRRKNNDPSNIVEKETEAQGDPLLGVTCDGELVKETPHVLGCNTAETVLSSKTQDGETVDSEDGQGSPIASLPRLKNDELLASVEAHKDERNSLSKSSPSSTFCDEKSAYSSRCPTGRISFKLYDWNPAEFPRRLRHQIFQWLENMPVELEGYIRPGCTILTVFIAMPESMWEKITQDVAHSLRDLINQPGSLLLGRGTFLIYLSNTIIQVLQDGTTLTNIKMEVQAPRLHYVYPSYFEAGKSLEFIACGSNLGHPKLRFLLSFCGKYLKHEVEQITTSSEHELFRIKVKHSDPEVFGPAFVEVENVSGISNFIPVLVGSKDVCSELERIEELFAGTRDDSSLVFHADASRSCKILMSRQYAMSTLLLDIAWLLKAPHPEEIEHLWSLTNVQRITSLLKFLLPNKFCSILRVIVCHLAEMNLFNWHLANLEYANAGLLSKLSLAFWDQDDPYDMGGDHCFLPGGNGRLVHALADSVPIIYEKTVHTIRYSGDGVQVISGSQVYDGDMVLCTVPLGVLKNGSIKFVPELPQRKLDGIKRLGFGLLNKVAMLFPHVFWNTDIDTFGHLSNDQSRRGEFFLFYSYATVAGGPLLIALVAGEAAHNFETMPPTDAVTLVLQILRGIFEPQGIEVPDPLQSVCTRWGTDSFSLGSYSHVGVGASGDDYDIMAESVGDGRLFFAGEATTRRYPATMHGAFISGMREAANMAHHANARALQIKVERSASKNTQACASLLADLFRDPDLEFGSFSVIFGHKSSEPKSPAILRVSLGGPRKRNTSEISRADQPHSNKLLFQQLQTHYNQQQQLHVYTLLSRQQALELREVRGGDDVRLYYLCEKLGVKLVGRRGLGPAADSVIASIKAERGTR